MNKRFVFCILMAVVSTAAFAQEEAPKKNVVMTTDIFAAYGRDFNGGFNSIGGGYSFGIPDKGAIGWTLGMSFFAIPYTYNRGTDDVGFKWSTETTFYKRLSAFDLGLEGALAWDFRYDGRDVVDTLRFTLAPMAAINAGVFRVQAAYRIDMLELGRGRFHSEIVATVGLRFGLDPVESLVLAWLLSALSLIHI